MNEDDERAAALTKESRVRVTAKGQLIKRYGGVEIPWGSFVTLSLSNEDMLRTTIVTTKDRNEGQDGIYPSSPSIGESMNLCIPWKSPNPHSWTRSSEHPSQARISRRNITSILMEHKDEDQHQQSLRNRSSSLHVLCHLPIPYSFSHWMHISSFVRCLFRQLFHGLPHLETS